MLVNISLTFELMNVDNWIDEVFVFRLSFMHKVRVFFLSLLKD